MRTAQVRRSIYALPASKFLTAALLFLAIESAAFADNEKCVSVFVDQNAVYDSFLRNPNFDGSVPVPPNFSFQATFPSTTGQRTIVSRSIEGLTKYKDLIHKLKRLSYPDEPAREREVGALRIEYLDGTVRVIQFTSNLIGEISGDDFGKAINQSGVLADTSSVRAVTHLHTHPRMDNLLRRTGEVGVGISFGDLDMSLFVNLKAQMTRFAGRNIPFTAIVIPNCDHCSDLAFVTEI